MLNTSSFVDTIDEFILFFFFFLFLGRQCMASCFFLMKQFDDVNIYLNSIKAYMYNDDDFNYNHGLALATTRNYKSAEEALLMVHNEKYKQEYVYIAWLARCYIMNGNPRRLVEFYHLTIVVFLSFNEWMFL